MLILFFRDSRRGDLATVDLSCMDSKASPPGTNLKNVICWREVQLPADMVQLFNRCVVQISDAVSKKCRRVHHCWI